MASQPVKQPATDCNGVFSEPRQLDLKEISQRGVWSIRSNANHDLNSFAGVVFNQQLKFGEMIKTGSLRLIQFWPQAAYLISDELFLPDSVSAFDTMVTDIGHGFCEFSLSGDRAVSFINDYTSVDINQNNIGRNRTVRTNLGHFSILLWWDEATDIHILVDRSYAQSLVDYLHKISDRWCIRDLAQVESDGSLSMINSSADPTQT